jgi:putative ABC transport system permease protein
MFLALREMRHAKARYALIMVIMLLVSFLVLFITGLAGGLAYATASAVENMPTRHFVLQENSDNRFSRSRLTEEQLKAVQAIVGESNATPLGVQMSTITLEGGTAKTDVTFFAIDLKGPLAPRLVEGEAMTNETEGLVIADRTLAKSGITPGSVIRDQATGLTLRVVGFTSEQSFSHTPVVFLNSSDWQRLKQPSGTNGGAGGVTPAAATVPAAGTDAGSTASSEAGSTAGAVANASSAAGATASSVATTTIAAPFNVIALQITKQQANELAQQVTGMEVISKQDAISGIPGHSAEQGSLMMMIVFLFIITAFVLAVFFYVITVQKTSQFGVLKAIGTQTGYLVRSVVGQVMALSLASLTASLLLIALASYMLPDGMPFQLKASTIVLSSVLLVAVGLLGSFVSVLRVTKVDALEAIGRAV